MKKPVLPRLLFAVKDSKWVSIKSVVSGLACGCHCAACGAPLIAKKGKKQQHHFAHAHGQICTGGLETSLHHFTKSVIVQAKTILLPAVEVFKGKVIQPARWIKADRVLKEHSIGRLRLDVWLEAAHFQLAVEVKVSHAVGNNKQRQLIQQGIPAIEVDVISIYQELLALDKGSDIAALRQAILQHSTHRSWLFSPLKHRWEYRIAKEAQRLKVRHSKQDNYHHYHVYRCPRHLRFVRGGFRDGQSYARVFQDCLHCINCREIVYKKEWVGFKHIPVTPQEVICSGL